LSDTNKDKTPGLMAKDSAKTIMALVAIIYAWTTTRCGEEGLI